MSLPNVIKDRDYLTRRTKNCLRCGIEYLATDQCRRRAEQVRVEESGKQPRGKRRRHKDYAAVLFCSKKCDDAYVSGALAKWEIYSPGSSVKVVRGAKPALLGAV